MSDLTRDSTISRASDLLDATVGRDVMLMSVAQGSYYALDSVAAVVWERLAAPTTLRALCHALTAQFDVSDAQCETDVLAFLEELRAARLLMIADDGA